MTYKGITSYLSYSRLLVCIISVRSKVFMSAAMLLWPVVLNMN